MNQDTNRLQLELVSNLADARKNVAVVGDDDQSIYGWRGAEVSNILEFEAHFPNPTVVKLEQNYRSTNAILNTANHLIKNNPRRRPKRLWSAAGDGAKVRIIQMSDDRQEAEFIGNEISQRCVNEGLRHEDFAVLFRMNAQSRLVEANLRELKIPYRVVGGKSFFDAREIKDFLAYASVLLNTDDDVSLLRIINTPARAIGASVVERATELSAKKKCSVFAALQDVAFRSEITPRAATAIDRFTSFLDQWETKLNTPLADQAAVLRAFIQETGYLEDLKRTCKTPDEALKRESKVVEMIRWFDEDAGRTDKGLRGFLDGMMLRRKGGGRRTTRRAAASRSSRCTQKGFEFRTSISSGSKRGLTARSLSSEGTVDEERRLLYVGITRARQTLAMSWCRTRIKYGSVQGCAPSSFIKELPADWIVHRDAAQILNAPVAEMTAEKGFAALKAMLAKVEG